MNDQLELPLWETLRSAQRVPEQINFEELLDQVEGVIQGQPETLQLKMAGDALLQLAEVYAMRAEVLITEWEEAYRDPRVEQGFFGDVVRQTMAVDLSELIESTPPRKPRTKRAKSEPGIEGSIAAPVEKAALLELVDQLEAAEDLERENQQAFEIAYEENVSAWVAAIAQWLEAERTHPVSFTHLCQRLGMPRIEVWLGVLLGEFELKQTGEFYGETFWITKSCR